MEVKSGYKKTEIGDLPEYWNILPLEKVCIPNGLVRGPFGGSLKKEFFVEDGYKVYEQRNAIYRSAELGSYFIDDQKYRELKRFEVKPKDFIVSCSGTIGRIFQVPSSAPKGVINQALLKITIDDQVVFDRFFLYLFEWEDFQKRIIDNTQGGAMQNLVGMSVFRKTQIPLPPLAEQCAIAAALSDVDALIASLDALIAKKRLIKQGAMQELLTGKRRLPGFSGEWNEKKFGEIGNRFLNGGTPSTKNADYWQGSIPWITGADIIGQRVQEPRRFITEDAVRNSATNIVEKGQLLVVTRTGVGKVAIAPYNLAISQDLTGVYLDSKKFSSEFLFRYFDYNSDMLRKLNQGTSIEGITRETLQGLKIYMPNIDEQRAIAGIISDMDSEILALEQQRNKTRLIKQGMMQELLTGRTRIV